MRRFLLTAAILTALAGGGFALAQAQTSGAKTTAPAQTGPGPGMMGGGAPGWMMNGNGMMGGGPGMMGGGMFPMMVGGASTKIEVKKIEKGVTITLTSPDAATVTRLQKMAEAMRLMHEAMAQ
jgi:hypothetical protein